MKKYLLAFLFVFFMSLLLPKISWAGTYYISHGAWQSVWANAQNRSTPTSWISAISNAAPGDTIVFVNDGGVFDDDAAGLIGGYSTSIVAQSGTPENWITYEGEAGTTVTLYNTYRQMMVNLSGLSYIKLKNFTLTSVQSYGIALLNGAHHITIENCTINAIGHGNATWAFIYANGAKNIIIRNCTINGGVAGNPTHADLVYFLSNYSASEYILFENNTINGGGSHISVNFTADAYPMSNIVIKNNSIEGKNHTTFAVYGVAANKPSHVLVENNILKNGGSICGTVTGDLSICTENSQGSARDQAMRREWQGNFQFMATDTVIRHNSLFNGGFGIGFTPSSNTTQRNRIYNNTIYGNCTGIYVPNWGWAVTDNVFLNNLLKDNTLPSSTSVNYPIYFALSSFYDVVGYAVEFGYNFSDEANNSYYRDMVTGIKTGTFTQLNADPGGTIFHNNIMGSALMSDAANYNFTLQSGSPAINAGGPLTTVQATDTGTGIFLKVADAKFFQDGSWGPTGEVSADWIAVGSPNNIAQINSINHSTNTIILTSGISRNVGDKVWLYKNSSGQQVLYGSASDIGAYEYDQAAPPSDTAPPAPPSGVTVQ